MALRTRGIFEHTIAREHRLTVPTLCKEVIYELGDFLNIVGFDYQKDKQKEWRWGWVKDFDDAFEQWILYEAVVWIFWPESTGLFLQLGPQTAILSFGLRWDTFVQENWAREVARVIFSQFAKKFGAKSALYLPDSEWSLACDAYNQVFEGKSCAEIVDHLVAGVTAQGSFNYHVQPQETLTRKKEFQSRDYQPWIYLIDTF